MSTVVADFIAEWRSNVRTFFDLPVREDGKLNVLTSVVAAKNNFVEEVKAGNVVLPCAVIRIGTFRKDTVYGAGSARYKRGEVAVVYLRQWGPSGTQESVAGPIADFANGVDGETITFTTCVTEGQADILADFDSPVNKELFSDSSVDVIAAVASWQDVVTRFVL